MSILLAVTEAFATWPQPRYSGPTLVVPTMCLYPSNGIVSVYVDGASHEYVVHDGGGAFDQFHAMGWHDATPIGVMRRAVRHKGLEITEEKAVIRRGVKPDELAGAISLVANASRDAAEYLISTYRPVSRRPLSDQIETLLDLRFPSQWRKEETFVGASNKTHRFDYVVTLHDDQKLLMDIVRPEASSINSVVVGHLDVKNAHPRGLVHRAVYDDQAKWSAENLSLIRVGAIPVPMSNARIALDQLAA
jgi:hypothetical protein